MRHTMRAGIVGFGWLLVLLNGVMAEPQASGSDNPFPPVRWTGSQAADLAADRSIAVPAAEFR